MKLSAMACALFSLAATTAFVSAADHAYPNKPLRLIVPFAPGGGADVLARVASAKVGEALGQQVVVDNRAGAGGNIAAEVTAKSAPDGYTLLQTNIAHTISVSLYRKLNYDLTKDFVPVTGLASNPFMLALNLNVPANSVKDLIALAKAKPGQLNSGSSGNGGPSHLATELFKTMAGVDIRHIPYKGGALVAIDLISGQVQMMFNTLPVILPNARAGRMKGLAIASSRRIPGAPEFPTFAEAGLPGFEVSAWYGVMVPTGTPPAIVNKLNVAFVGALKMPDVRERLASENFEVVGSSPTDFGVFVKTEIAKWAKIVKISGAHVD